MQFVLAIIAVIGSALIGVYLNKRLIQRLSELGMDKTEKSNQLRWSSQQKPTIGGVTMLFFFLPVTAMAIYLWDERLHALYMLPVMIAGFMGLLDDLRGLKARSKFLIQLGCGIMVAWMLPEVAFFNLTWLDVSIKAFWVILLMNSINMLDNMDGISGSLSMVVAAAICLMIFVIGGWSVILSLGLIAALASFLWFNYPPSKIFMGDAGSQILGCALAILTLQALGSQLYLSGWDLVLNLCLLLLPSLTDTAIVTVNRIIGGQSPFVGGKDHTTHNLAYLGKSSKWIANTFISLTLVSAIMVWINIYFPTNLFRFICVLYMVGYASAMWAITRKNLKQGKFTYSK